MNSITELHMARHYGAPILFPNQPRPLMSPSATIAFKIVSISALVQKLKRNPGRKNLSAHCRSFHDTWSFILIGFNYQ